MTTNVTDIPAKMMASDSRWSVQRPSFVLFIDDAGFEKIVTVGATAYMFAGNGLLIQQWKDWLATGPTSHAGCPNASGVAICMVHMPTAIVLFQRGQSMHPRNAYFAGSGALHARTCWDANSNAIQAVESAKLVDILSGGPVKYVMFSCGSNNLSDTRTIQDVTLLLAQKGTVMYANGNQAGVPVTQAAANDSAVQEVLNKVASGDLVANAPCHTMYDEWPAEDVERLHGALDKALAR